MHEVLLSIKSLNNNGCLVFKFFGFNDVLVCSMITLLQGCFKSVVFVKPFSSRPNSKELYFVGAGFLQASCAVALKWLGNGVMANSVLSAAVEVKVCNAKSLMNCAYFFNLRRLTSLKFLIECKRNETRARVKLMGSYFLNAAFEMEY